ncbi:MAG: DUF4747 family protein [Chitinophagaceae bacterium]
MAYSIINIALQFKTEPYAKRSDRYMKLFKDLYNKNYAYQMNKKEKLFIYELKERKNLKGLSVISGVICRGIFPSDEAINIFKKEVEKTPDNLKEDVFHSKKATFYFYPHKHYCVVDDKIPPRTLKLFFENGLIDCLTDEEELAVNVYPCQGSINTIRKNKYFKKVKFVITLPNSDDLKGKASWIADFLKKNNLQTTSIDASTRTLPIPYSEEIDSMLDIIALGNGYAVVDTANEIGQKKNHIDTREQPEKIFKNELPEYEELDFIETMLPKKENIDNEE